MSFTDWETEEPAQKPVPQPAPAKQPAPKPNPPATPNKEADPKHPTKQIGPFQPNRPMR